MKTKVGRRVAFSPSSSSCSTSWPCISSHSLSTRTTPSASNITGTRRSRRRGDKNCIRGHSSNTILRASISSSSLNLNLNGDFSINKDKLSRETDMPDPSNYLLQNSHHTSLSQPVILFYSAETKELATKVAQENANIELGEISWDKFADGFPNLFVKNAELMRNRHVAFLASFHRPDVIFEQLSIIYALPRMFVGSFSLVLPFFPTGTLERVEDEGEIATAFTLARMLSNIPLSRGGPASLIIYDIHALQERFYFSDNVLPLFESGIPMLKARLQQLPDADSVTIAYPDEGAWKRFNKMFGDEWGMQIICTKVRDDQKRIVRVKEGEPKGRHVVIVDDLVQSGGTLIECHRVLAEMGATKVSAYVTHGVFPNKSFQRFEAASADGGASSGFTHFWMTDSCPQTVAAIGDRKPFEVLSLSQSIASALMI